MPVGQWFDGFYDKFFRWVVQTVITKSKVYLKKNRGGSKWATPSLRNYIKQRARLHTAIFFIGTFWENFSEIFADRSDDMIAYSGC